MRRHAMPFTPDSPVPRPEADVVDVELDGERVIYRPATDRVARLDPVGSIVWQVLDGQGTVADLAADVAEGFGIDTATAGEAICTLLDDLEAQRFLEGSGAAEAGPARGAEPGFLADPPSP